MFTCAYHSAHFTWMGQGLCVIKIYRHRSLYYWKPFIMRGPIYSGLSKMTFTTQVICPFKYRCDPYLSVSWLVAFREYVGTKTTLFSFKTKLEKIAAAIVLWFKCVFYIFFFIWHSHDSGRNLLNLVMQTGEEKCLRHLRYNLKFSQTWIWKLIGA